MADTEGLPRCAEQPTAHHQPATAAAAAGEPQPPSGAQRSQNVEGTNSGLAPPPAFNEAEKDMARQLHAQVNNLTWTPSLPLMEVGSVSLPALDLALWARLVTRLHQLIAASWQTRRCCLLRLHRISLSDVHFSIALGVLTAHSFYQSAMTPTASSKVLSCGLHRWRRASAGVAGRY